MLVCSLGDALLDVIVRPQHQPGRGDDAPAETRVGAGGQAANVAAWAVELGAEARVIAKRADDEAGSLVQAELAARGVEVLGPVVSGRTGVVISLVEPDGERTMLSDRGVSPALRAEELEMEWFRGADILHLSGYALLAKPIEEAGAKAAGAVRALGARISVDLAARSAIAEFGAERLLARLAELAPDVVFAGEGELEALRQEPAVSTLVVKRGAQGCTVVEDGKRTEHAALPVTAVDTTGAGDAFAAGFLLGGPALALEAAARCVSSMGAMP